MKPNGWVEENYSYTLPFKGFEYGESLEIVIDKGVIRDPYLYLSSECNPYICDELVKLILSAKVHNRNLIKLSK